MGGLLAAVSARYARARARSVVVRTLGENMRAHWRPYALNFLFMAIIAGTTAGTAWVMRDMINQIFIEKNAAMLAVVSATVAGLFTVRGLATYLQTTTLSRVGNRIVAQTQRRLFDHLLLMDVKFFRSSESGDLIARVALGADAARRIVDLIVTSFGRDLVTLVALAAVVVVQSPLMAGITLLTVPFAVVGIIALGRKIRSYARAEMQGFAQIVSVLQETSHGASLVKAFGLNDFMRGRMAEAITGVELRANQMAILQARASPLMETLAGVGISVVLLFAGWQAIEYDRTPGEFMAFLAAFLLAYEPARRLAKMQVELVGLKMYVQMMYDLFDRLPGATEVPHASDLVVTTPNVELRQVRFAYLPDTPVLHDVDFAVGPGEKVALVGASGGGKTTIFNLIQRFYDVDGGAIVVDGQDVRGVSSASLRAAISYVSQDTYLFSGTVRDNIRLGKLDATDGEIEDAARQANADTFIARLEHGYDTRVGENGARLSGGQRQRVAIARAFLRAAPIILLDEPTSALDPNTERAVQDALARLTRGRAAIVIAHRLSTVVDADRILVVDGGRIVESGRHAELLRAGGIYASFCRQQFPAAFGEDIRASA